MAESHDRIEAQETTGGERENVCSKRNFGGRKSYERAVVSEFLTESSLHGLKYIGQPKRNILERSFWVVTFIIGLAAAGFLIYGVFNRYEETPVVVSFQSSEQAVDTIPFPAVTFCSNQQFSKASVENLKRKLANLTEGEPEYHAMSELLSNIDSLCKSRKSLFDVYSERSTSHLSPRLDYYYTKNQTQFQQEIIDLLLMETPSCEEIFALVLLDGSPMDRWFVPIFRPVITEYGKCCTFNMLPMPLMLKLPSEGYGNKADIFNNPVLGTQSYHWGDIEDIDDWRKWNYEKSFILSPDRYESRIIPNHVKLSHPFRNQRLGYRFGLSVVIRTFEPYCDKVAFRGTTFMLHNPVDIPRIGHFPSVIGINQEAFIKIHPDITLADPDIKDLTIEKRKCLFGGEKKLKYFSPYTQDNCFEECIANLIEKKCKCSKFYMPRPNGTIICQLDGLTTEGNCVIDTLSLLSNKTTCGHCLPLCEYIDYNSELTTAPILNWNNSLYGTGYVRNSLMAHIFYDSPSTVPKLRKRLYGITDLIANTGGILGLCLGFSVLSGAEVLYYVLMRSIWQTFFRRYGWCKTYGASASSAIGTLERKNPAEINYSGKDKESRWNKAFFKSCCKKKNISLKFKWLYCIIVGLATSGFLVYMLFFRNEKNINKTDTIKISLDVDNKHYWSEATFCYTNQFSMEKVLEFRRIANSTTDPNLRNSAETNLSIIDAMCNYKDALETSSGSTFPPINPDVANYTFLFKFLEENTISCSQMFPACVYKGLAQSNCSEIITTVYTIYGKCCTMSMTPISLEIPQSSNGNLTNITNHFNSEMDEIPGADQNFTVKYSSLFNKTDFNSPFVVEAVKASKKSPFSEPPFYFSLLLNLNEDTYQCQSSTTSSHNIVFTLHPPGKRPEVQDFSSLQVANEEIVITVFPMTVYIDGHEKIINSGNENCEPHIWPSHSRRGSTGFSTTKAAYLEGCSRWFIASNCRCGFIGNEWYRGSSFCKAESNSNDSICVRKMNELVNEMKSLCSTAEPRCRGTDYLFETTNQSMTNAEELWASLIKFGNDTSGAIPWANNKTGIIHFVYKKSRKTPELTDNGKPQQNSIAGGGGFLAMILITVVASLTCISLIAFPHLWRCICGSVVKCTLHFRGALQPIKT